MRDSQCSYKALLFDKVLPCRNRCVHIFFLKMFFVFYTEVRFLCLILSLRRFTAREILKWVIVSFLLFGNFQFCFSLAFFILKYFYIFIFIFILTLEQSHFCVKDVLKLLRSFLFPKSERCYVLNCTHLYLWREIFCAVAHGLVFERKCFS